MKRLFIILLSIAVFIGMFNGCSIGGKSDYTPTGSGLHSEDAPQENGGTPQENAKQVTLTYYPEKTLNPYACNDFTNRALFTLLYQSLFTVDRNYHIEPVLCSSYKVSDKMDVYTFYVEEATFSDGSVLTALDVVNSLLAAQEGPVYAGRFRHFNKISVTADGGVEIKLDTPSENLPLLLDIPIVKFDQTNADYPVGTGPYFYQETTGGGRLFQRETWWCSAKLAVTVPSITLVTAETPAKIRDNFEFSSLDLVCADPGSDHYVDFRCDYELWESENGIFLYLACNTKSKVFSIPEVRAALTHAIDRDLLVDEYYRGFAQSATLPASPRFPYYSTKLAAEYGYDAIQFTQAVNDAQLRETPIVLLVNKGDTLRLRVARKIGNMLSDCGLVVQMKELAKGEYDRALKNGSYDLYLGQTMLSPNMDLGAFFGSSGALHYGINDIGMYTLCKEALANHGNYYTLHRTIMEDGRLVPILFRSYAIYTTRGLLTELNPARDSLFYYSLGKTMEDALIQQ